MEKKYLLYIDILGFSELVEKEPNKIKELFTAIDNLNAHRHNAFGTIVFSDTILIYSLNEPKTERDHQYVVMYMCEFVQDLMRYTIINNIFFRAIILYDEFIVKKLNNIESYYGQALITAYKKEKDITCTGLFIRNECQKYNLFFHTAEYDNELSFVYINSSLEYFKKVYDEFNPLDISLLNDTDTLWDLVWDIDYLKNIHRIMNDKNTNIRVRDKHRITWQFYKQRYNIIDKLEKNGFSYKVICEEFDWEKRVQFKKDYYKRAFEMYNVD